MGKLTTLDMKDVDIVAGGDGYFNGIQWLQTKDNEISPYMFSRMNTLTTIILPESVVKIEEAIFYESKKLTYITFGGNVKEIGDGIFIGTKPVHLGIPHSVEKMGEKVFQNCGSLRTSFLSKNMSEIPYGTYYGCTNLTSFVSIPEKVEKIGKQAFYNCKALLSFKFPDNVIEIGEEAFAGSAIINLVIPPMLESISAGAFKGCESLKMVTFNNITKIAKEAFSGCVRLETINIPEGVTEIEARAFTNCKKATIINIPSTINEIREHSFSYCESVSSVTIPKGVVTIKNAAFEGCSNLKSVYFSQDVTQIEDGAFNYCPLENIYVLNTTPPSVGNSNFSDFETSTLYVPKGTIDEYKSAPVWSNFKNIVEKDFSSINKTDKNDFKISVTNGSIGIDSEYPVTVSIYNISGISVYVNHSFYGVQQIELAKGYYIVKVNDSVTKILIK